jgi:hypothetical protein
MKFFFPHSVFPFENPHYKKYYNNIFFLSFDFNEFEQQFIQQIIFPTRLYLDRGYSGGGAGRKVVTDFLIRSMFIYELNFFFTKMCLHLWIRNFP